MHLHESHKSDSGNNDADGISAISDGVWLYREYGCFSDSCSDCGADGDAYAYSGSPTATPVITATPTPLPATPTPDEPRWIQYEFHWANEGGDTLKEGLPDISYSIVITGGTTSPVTLTYSDLKAMSMVKMTATMQKHSGTSVTSEWVGVSTMDILAKAGLPSGSFTITMTASDGFSSPDFTAAQLQGTILGLKRNDVALDTNIDGDNPIQLVVPGDYGSSWIKVPTQIVITPA